MREALQKFESDNLAVSKVVATFSSGGPGKTDSVIASPASLDILNKIDKMIQNPDKAPEKLDSETSFKSPFDEKVAMFREIFKGDIL